MAFLTSEILEEFQEFQDNLLYEAMVRWSLSLRRYKRDWMREYRLQPQVREYFRKSAVEYRKKLMADEAKRAEHLRKRRERRKKLMENPVYRANHNRKKKDYHKRRHAVQQPGNSL